MDRVVIGRGVRSRPQSPFSDDLYRVCGQQDPAQVGASPLDHLDGGFGVLLRRGGFPRVSFEPGCLRRKPLCPEKFGAEAGLRGAGELQMMGELVNEFAAQSCRGARYPHRKCRGVWSVLRPIVEFPGRFERDRRDAIESSRVRREKVVPGFVGEGAQIIWNTLGVE